MFRPVPVRTSLLSMVTLLTLLASLHSPAMEERDEQIIGEFLLLLVGSPEGKREALAFVEQHWQKGFTPMLIEVLTFNRDPAFGPQLVELLQAKTGQANGYDIRSWQRWLWNQKPETYPHYADFKAALYGLIDSAFEGYFDAGRKTRIRLDEVVWGGVNQDGIPPLRNPDMVAAVDADYLADTDVVFGLSVNGDARAYPRRILGWHEMFVDRVGGKPVAGVYCTLCGTMILYATEVGGRDHELGTSGFLYRSNKLMYDRATQSLWNTLWGEPVVGPLVDEGIALPRLSVVTTTWGEWRRRHPDTQVLSLGTGYARDYSEGAAYRDYFATDDLMFQVPALDSRLRNKDEVLGLILPQHPDQPLAIAADYLQQHPLYQDSIDGLRLVVLTDPSGANRVYEARDRDFTRWDGANTVVDSQGIEWKLSEARLQSAAGHSLYRLPAHRAFWFGWFSAYGHTRLVH